MKSSFGPKYQRKLKYFLTDQVPLRHVGSGGAGGAAAPPDFGGSEGAAG